MNPDKPELLFGLYGKFINRRNAVGFCRYHRVALKKDDLKAHECLKKHCKALRKYETNKYWADRERTKELRKARKERLRRMI